MKERSTEQPSPRPEPAGLTSDEARLRLQRYGLNAIPEGAAHPWRSIAARFWAPIPWMLEFAIALEVLLGRTLEALVFAVLLVFNALLSAFQEGRAQRALALLRKRLTVQARAFRDGRWILIHAEELVPGDVVRLRAGDLVAADVKIFDGQLLADQSALTGESLPVEIEPGGSVYAGSIVKRGEATGEVAATGTRTTFGKTAALVRTAKIPGHLEVLIARIVRYLIAVDVVLVVGVLVYGFAAGLPAAEIVPFALIILIASIPVALPATFTLATALGSVELAGRGVLVTRLSAIEEAAQMDVLCTDKTGTLTQNQPTVMALWPRPPCTEDELLRAAALACDEATQDPIDLAILAAARARGLAVSGPERLRTFPFDPTTKRSGAVLRELGRTTHVLKGAFQAITPLLKTAPAGAAQAVERMAAGGARVLAVAAGPDGAVELAGLIALHDPPRPDSPALVQLLRDLGIRVLMLTGDNAVTAGAIAAQVGIGTRVGDVERDAERRPLEYDIFARVLPEGKFRLVRALQSAGHVVGMTGDGVNDAPALGQAEVGIAVAQATDVAKAAASLVLTTPGLVDIVSAVETSRRIHQRMLTYTLNKIVKTLEISLLLSLGLIFAGVFVTTPLLIVLLLFANDFVTMSIAADRVSFGAVPDRWDVRSLMGAALSIAAILLCFSFGVVWAGRSVFRLAVPTLQTAVFVWLVLSGQGTVYLVRGRRNFWGGPPGRWLVVSTLGDLFAVTLLATRGWLMAPVGPGAVLLLLGLALAYFAGADLLKTRILRRFGLR
ncbi:MAG TPA: plasma-membrane proton-efflux P-type ATPase [bacterium]|nr:plasma-membrane proton-efflux P-type ATPase [bacterium]